MGEVKRYTPDTFGDGVVMVEVRADERYETSDETEFCEALDVARLERERDQAMSAHADMVREIEASQAEMTRLRAVEAAALYALKQLGLNNKERARNMLAEACGRKG